MRLQTPSGCFRSIALRALLRKELLLIGGQKNTRRAGLVQAGVVIVALGMVPLIKKGQELIEVFQTLPLVLLLVSGLAAASLAADMMCAARSQPTLQALMAQPSNPRWAVAAKAVTSICYGFIVSMTTLAVMALAHKLSGEAWLWSSGTTLATIGGCAFVAVLGWSLGSVVGVHTQSVRLAVQMSSGAYVICFGLGFGAFSAFNLEVSANPGFGALVLSALVLIGVLNRWLLRKFCPERMFG